MKTYKGYVFKRAVQDLILKCAAELNLSVRIKWTDAITTAGINCHGDLYLADVLDDAVLKHKDLVKYCGYGVHELLHSKHTNFNATSNTDYLRTLHNAVEDAWIEHRGIDQCFTGNISNLLGELIEMMVADAIKNVQSWSDPAQYPFALAVYLRNHAKTKVPLAKGLKPIFDEAAVRLKTCQSSYDTLGVAEWVLEQLKGLPKKPPAKQPKPSKSPDQDQGKGEGKGDAENAPEDAPDDGEAGDATAPSKDTEAMPVEPTLDAEEKGGQGGYCESGVRDADRVIGDKWLEPDIVVPAKLRHEIKRLFDNSGLDEFQMNRKAGSINTAALSRAGFSAGVFKRRHEADGIDSAVAIVLDISDSMTTDGGQDPKTGRGLRLLTATQACIALLDTLNRAQVQTAVLAFAQYTAVIKPFSMSAKKGVEALCKIRTRGSTNDYFAVRHAHNMLMDRPERRKITFVLTDGYGNTADTKTQVQVGNRMGITTIGIGIQQSVERIYDQAVRVDEINQLGKVSFNQIKLTF
jgi:Mg-chelatase subunit ChlD